MKVQFFVVRRRWMMGGRYYLTGVQLGMLMRLTDEKEIMKILEEILDNQFIGNISQGEKKEVVLKENQDE